MVFGDVVARARDVGFWLMIFALGLYHALSGVIGLINSVKLRGPSIRDEEIELWRNKLQRNKWFVSI
ncbi:Uncharacterised protein [Zhongshania aliphaticivorans]|uniref:Uncharacterized protein n=1 Tax=Zhongshania aliphaticivorans TaxID=1470434 RepID=A0A5S9N7R3_9GAMM|nr:Uncharacterised protein [Zhongshania aliphaticivorans]